MTAGTEGSLTLTINGGSTQYPQLISDVVTSITDSVSASVTRVPIVTFKADQAFAFDTGTTSSMSFSITRMNPADPDDSPSNTNSRTWSNKRFEKELVRYIDRWQAETDGCQLVFEPFTSGQRTIEENVYLSSISISVEKGIAETLYISLDVDVGTMTARAVPIIRKSTVSGYLDPVYWNESVVTMTSSDGVSNYVLYLGVENQWNCVSSYSVKCGPEQAFPSLILNISKKNLSAVAPDLVDDIIAGKNRIMIYGVGRGEYVVTKTYSSGQNYKITAYSVYEQYSASPVSLIGEDFTFGDVPGTKFKTPFDMLVGILTDAISYGTEEISKISFNLDKIVYCYRKVNNEWSNELCQFSASQDAWYVMNVCALRLGCKIWFMDDKVYIVDLSIDNPNSPDVACSTNFAFFDMDTLYLNRNGYYPLNPSASEIAFMQSVCGDTELGDEGADVLRNFTVVKNNTPDPAYTDSDDGLIDASRRKFGIKRTEYVVSEISIQDAYAIAYNTDMRYCDSEQSIGFRLSETHYDEPEEGEEDKGRYWQPYFPQLARVSTIFDYSKDLMISNKPNFSGPGVPKRMRNKLTLSTAEYHFPEGYTEYWFGVISPANLTQGTSIINNIVYNG